MELLCTKWPNLDDNISETIRNSYFWVEEEFLRFSSSLQSFLILNFSTKTAKVRNGHFWTVLKKSRVFLIFKSFKKNFWTQFARKFSPKYLETLYLVFRNILNWAWNCCFCTMNFVVAYMFWDKFVLRFVFLKIRDIHLNSNYFFNQNISQDSREFFVVFNFSEKFIYNWVKLQKNDK